jgi:hypothetical protein
MPPSEQAAFRATFLLQLDPQYREALERTGWLLENLFRNLENDAESAADLDAQLGAVATDLRHLASVLGWIGRHQTASELLPAQTLIAQRAVDAASKVQRLIEELEGVDACRAMPQPDGLPVRVGPSVPIPFALAQAQGLEAGSQVEWKAIPGGLALRKVEEGPES